MDKLQENTEYTKKILDIEKFLSKDNFNDDIEYLKYLNQNIIEVVLGNKLFKGKMLILKDKLLEITLIPNILKSSDVKYISDEEYKKAKIEYSLDALKLVYGEPSKYTYKVMQFEMLDYYLYTDSIFRYGSHSGYKWDFNNYQIMLLTSEGNDTKYAGHIIIGFK